MAMAAVDASMLTINITILERRPDDNVVLDMRIKSEDDPFPLKLVHGMQLVDCVQWLWSLTHMTSPFANVIVHNEEMLHGKGNDSSAPPDESDETSPTISNQDGTFHRGGAQETVRPHDGARARNLSHDRAQFQADKQYTGLATETFP